MVGIDEPALLIIIALALGYAAAEKVRDPIKKTGHAICHVVTFGKKCAPRVWHQGENLNLNGVDLLPPLPLADPPCPTGYVFLDGDSLHGCFDARTYDKPQP